MNAALAAAAHGLIGVRFRLHGRDPATGLDCVGLVAEAMRRAGFAPVVPIGYSLRSAEPDRLLPFARLSGLIAEPRSPDILLVRVNAVQQHLLIATATGFIHAHAGIGRVVLMPGACPWPIARGWRVSHHKED
ncbi:peptidoglycan endopeptidase [Novosphingobium sp. FKTRR1]|uniref:peptidoglycan endopeptidase n=1 Tax=Novosphingobium sp. FKTRR1 TaxID=2879118 RepID=UPI001CF04612|nr:peptidoglycan endopeptidase [Novosphingobium sp. FKTRR1]